jgi:hypothetical protein
MAKTTNELAREAIVALDEARNALLRLECQLEGELENIHGPEVDVQLEIIADLVADKVALERTRVRAIKVVRNTNPKES